MTSCLPVCSPGVAHTRRAPPSPSRQPAARSAVPRPPRTNAPKSRTGRSVSGVSPWADNHQHILTPHTRPKRNRRRPHASRSVVQGIDQPGQPTAALFIRSSKKKEAERTQEFDLTAPKTQFPAETEPKSNPPEATSQSERTHPASQAHWRANRYLLEERRQHVTADSPTQDPRAARPPLGQSPRARKRT